MNDTTNNNAPPAAPPGPTVAAFGPDVARQSLEARKSFAEKLRRLDTRARTLTRLSRLMAAICRRFR
jgi:hypothetical protein